MNTKRNIFLWILYDFANSLASIVFFLYFAQWIVIEQGLSDLLFNLTFTTSTILLILSAPYAGILLDKHLCRITGLRWSTCVTVALYIACAFCAISNNSIAALIFFTIGIYAYQLTFTFYTPLINDITTSEKRGRVSGYGIAANYLGQFAGLLLVLPFSKGTLSFFEASPRAETLLPAAILFFIFSLPMLLFFKELKKEKKASQFGSGFKELVYKTKELLSHPGVGLFILSYFLFNDAVLTASNNFPIFLEQVWGVSDTIKTYILLGIVLTSAIGGLVSGFVADKIGHKKVMVIILSGWIFILPFIGFIPDFMFFVVATVVMGFWFGASWAVSRSMMAYLTPPQSGNLAFSYFNLIERASSLIGPIVWGLVVTNFIDMGIFRYRLGTLALTVFIVFGFFTLLRVKSDRA